MKVVVHIKNFEEPDEHSECFGTVDEDGSLTIVQWPDMGVVVDYETGEWLRYEVTA